MTAKDILYHRLVNQQIAASVLTTPQDVVSHLVAMQSQEYAMAKWAIGLRLPKVAEDDIEQAYNKGEILRTHAMRPTWHFVAPKDIRWLQQLTSPRVHAINAYTYRVQGLDAKTFKKCNDIMVKALEGNNHLTRDEIRDILEKKKIDGGNGIRMSAIMMQAELDGIICSGTMKGKQHSYALIDEWVPKTKAIRRDEALALFAERFFASRGPASAEDFAYWSGLTMKDCKTAAESLGKDFVRITIDGNEYYYKPITQPVPKQIQTTFLMPDYDEYGMSYKNRNAMFSKSKSPTADIVFNRMLIIEGKIEGTWRRTIKGKEVKIETEWFAPLPKSKQGVFSKAVDKYCAFIGKELSK